MAIIGTPRSELDNIVQIVEWFEKTLREGQDKLKAGHSLIVIVPSRGIVEEHWDLDKKEWKPSVSKALPFQWIPESMPPQQQQPPIEPDYLLSE